MGVFGIIKAKMNRVLPLVDFWFSVIVKLLNLKPRRFSVTEH